MTRDARIAEIKRNIENTAHIETHVDYTVPGDTLLAPLRDVVWLLSELEKEIERGRKLREALDLALYYVEGDATWEGVVMKVEAILGHTLMRGKVLK